MPETSIHLVRWLTIAAFVAVFVLLSVGSGDQPLNINAQDNLPTPTPQTFSFRGVNPLGDSGERLILPEVAEAGVNITLLSPEHKSTVVDRQSRLTWTPIANARWYQIKIMNAKGKKIAKQKFKDVDTICSESTCSITLIGLDVQLVNGKKYRWQVKAKFVDNTGNAVKSKSPKNSFFAQIGNADYVPTVKKSENETTNEPYPVFVWDDVPGAKKYTITVRDGNKKFYKKRVEPEDVCQAGTCALLTRFAQLPRLEHGITYNWQVQVQGASGKSTSSTTAVWYTQPETSSRLNSTISPDMTMSAAADGKIVFVDGAIYIIDPDGTNLQMVLLASCNHVVGAFCDVDSVAYDGDTSKPGNENGTVYFIAKTFAGFEDFVAVWNKYQIYSVEPGGDPNNPTTVQHTCIDEHKYNLSLSPDGDRLAFNMRDLPSDTWQIAYISPDTVCDPDLLPLPPAIIPSAYQSGWSANGNRLAYVDDQNQSIKSIKLTDLSVKTHVTTTGWQENISIEDFDWSSDGYFVLTGNYGTNGAQGLYLVDKSTGNYQRLSTTVDTTPNWSADGQSVVLDRALVPPQGSSFPDYPDLYVLDIDTATSSVSSELHLSGVPTAYHYPDWDGPEPSYLINVDGPTSDSGSGSEAIDVPFVDSLTNDGICSFREAIVAANEHSVDPENYTHPDCAIQQGQNGSGCDGYCVEVAAGGRFLLSHIGDPQHNSAFPAINTRITIRPRNGGSTTTFERAFNQFRLIKILPDGHLTLDNIIIKNGDIIGDGGGIHNEGTLILRNNSAVIGNLATGNGGGIYNAPGATLDLQGAQITDNVAFDLGGGVYNEGTVAQLNDGCFVGNTGLDGSDIYSTVSVVANNVWWGHTSGPILRANGGNAINDLITVQNPSGVAVGNCASYSTTCSASIVANMWETNRHSATTQEAYDMRAVVAVDASGNLGSGLTVHSGPTLNAMKIGTVSWETDIVVESRLRFPIYPNFPDPQNPTPTAGQTWYQISSPQAGWIMARMVNFEPDAAQPAGVEEGNPDEFYYVEDGDPCGNEVAEPTGNLTFTYDRRAAAEYGIAHAYRNSISIAGAEYPGWINPDHQGRVTNRIKPTSITDVFIPYIDRIRYAPFIYERVFGTDFRTGSAVFNSEVIWMGGLPWTYHVGNDGTILRDAQYANCEDRNEQTSGWRYCLNDDPHPYLDPPAFLSSWPSDAHTGITRYYSKDNLTTLSQNVLGDQRGDLIAIFDLYKAGNPNFADGPLCDASIFVNKPLPAAIEGECDSRDRNRGFPNLNNDATRQVFYNQFISNTAFLNNDSVDGGGGGRNLQGMSGVNITGALHEMTRGNYITVPSGDGHGFFVVGWGPIVSCPRALGEDAQFSNILWILANDPEIASQASVAGHIPLPIFSSSNDAIPYESEDVVIDEAFNYSYVVPYVVDFPGSIDRPESAEGHQLQRPRPRPFYCSTYNDPTSFDSTWEKGFWLFYTFLDNENLQIIADVLYTPELNWEWTEND